MSKEKARENILLELFQTNADLKNEIVDQLECPDLLRVCAANRAWKMWCDQESKYRECVWLSLVSRLSSHISVHVGMNALRVHFRIPSPHGSHEPVDPTMLTNYVQISLQERRASFEMYYLYLPHDENVWEQTQTEHTLTSLPNWVPRSHRSTSESTATLNERTIYTLASEIYSRIAFERVLQVSFPVDDTSIPTIETWEAYAKWHQTFRMNSSTLLDHIGALLRVDGSEMFFRPQVLN